MDNPYGSGAYYKTAAHTTTAHLPGGESVVTEAAPDQEDPLISPEPPPYAYSHHRGPSHYTDHRYDMERHVAQEMYKEKGYDSNRPRDHGTMREGTNRRESQYLAESPDRRDTRGNMYRGSYQVPSVPMDKDIDGIEMPLEPDPRGGTRRRPASPAPMLPNRFSPVPQDRHATTRYSDAYTPSHYSGKRDSGHGGGSLTRSSSMPTSMSHRGGQPSPVPQRGGQPNAGRFLPQTRTVPRATSPLRRVSSASMWQRESGGEHPYTAMETSAWPRKEISSPSAMVEVCIRVLCRSIRFLPVSLHVLPLVVPLSGV